MSDYERVTRECDFSELRPELRQSLLETMGRLKAGNSAGLLFCGETVSKKKAGKRSLLGGEVEEAYYVAVLVTSEWLMWARSGATGGGRTSAARLAEISVQDYDVKLAARLTGEAGIEVTGIVEGSDYLVKGGLIGLGKGPASEKLKRVLFEAVKTAHPEPRRKRSFPGF